jgi:putative DNA primase/helicase
VRILDAIRSGPFDTANAYVAAGLSIIPVGIDGRKQPAFSVLPRTPDLQNPGKTKGTWKPFEKRLATTEEILLWHGGQTAYGIAIVGGPISGHLCILDFEKWSAFQRWGGMLDSEERRWLARCPVARTPGKANQPDVGAHLYLRLVKSAPGEEYAMDAAGNCLIETRGEGNYVVAPGSPACCHPKGVPYCLVRPGWLDGEPFEPIPTEVFNRLCFYAAQLNEYSKPAAREIVGDRSTTQAGDRPGDDFNVRAKWGEILNSVGWSVYATSDSVTYWCRSGKKPRGVSGTTGYCKSPSGNDLLWVFSTSAPPFEAKTSYSKFGAYALLNHQGDFTAATRALGTVGYGVQRGRSKGVRASARRSQRK